MKLNSAAVILFLAFGTPIVAQEQLTPFVYDEFPQGTPEWMFQLKDKNVNVFEMEKLFSQYLEENPDAKFKKNGTKPIVNYYRRWHRANAPFVNKNGNIVLPTIEQYAKTVDFQNDKQKLHTAKNGSSEKRTWQPIGPFSTYDYKNKKATPNQVNVFRLDVAETNSNTLYCGVETGMVFKSLDKGKTWQPCDFSHNFGGSILAVKIDPKDENRVIVGSQYFLWETKDGGNSWTKLDKLPVSVRIDAIEIDPNDSNKIWVATMRGLYHSENSGQTFIKKINGTNHRAMDLKFNPVKSNELYVLLKEGTYIKGIYRSEDSGKNFTFSPFGLDNAIAGRLGLSTANGGAYIYALVTTATRPANQHLAGEPRIIKSTDFGKTWTVNRGYFKCQAMGNQDEVRGGQGYYDMAIIPSNDNPEHIIYGLTDIYASEDGGVTGRNLGGYCGEMNLHVDIQSLKNVGSETWMTTDGGINFSTDFFRNSNEVLQNGIYASDFWGFDQGWNEDVMAGGRWHNGDMVQTDFYGNFSVAVDGAEEPTGYVFLSNPRKVAFSDAPNVVLPDTFQEVFPNFNYDKYPIESKRFGSGMENDPRYAMSFIQSDNRDRYALWKTTDDGESFTELYRFPEEIRDYKISRTNPDKIYLFTKYDFYVSENGGETFTEKPLNGVNTYFGFKLQIHPENDNEIWLTNADTKGFYKSTDGGDTWQNVTGNLGDQKVMNIVVTGDKKNSVYVVADTSVNFGGESGFAYSKIYYKNDELQDWQDVSAGLPSHINIIKLMPFYKKGVLRAASDKGIWELPLVENDMKPIAQPLILNSGKPTIDFSPIHFDSYSIVKQEGVKWTWTFSPEVGIDDPNIRNPKIEPKQKGYHSVTLKIETKDGQISTKTINNMFYYDGQVLSTHKPNDTSKSVEIYPTMQKKGSDILVRKQNISERLQIHIFDASGRQV
ncbi:MAG: hypothetical protein Q4G16_10925, partial [Cruoricaptor ignavus]|nr:hypothetical protein [Cruoricaptor ignavus]